jgi:hypothetical protein
VSTLRHGHDLGHPPHHGFDWGDYVTWLVAREGSLSAVAERLCAARAWTDDRASIERALRRLRDRGDRDGGLWGARCLTAFGLPDALERRARWIGSYHSRFTDMPVALCEDLVRLWDRAPFNTSPTVLAWIALAHASCTLRSARIDDATPHLRRARAAIGSADAAARSELLLTEAFVASRNDPSRVDARLDEAASVIATVDDAAERRCLHARQVDQVAWQWNKGRRGAPAPATAEALYRTLDDEGAPPFARCRRASGLAYCRYKLGAHDEAIALARAACDHAGNGGHLRLRAMSLQMLARVTNDPHEADDARSRALAIASQLDDEALRLRFTQPTQR